MMVAGAKAGIKQNGKLDIAKIPSLPLSIACLVTYTADIITLTISQKPTIFQTNVIVL